MKLEDLVFKKDWHDLIIEIKNTNDSLRIQYWFSGDAYSSFQFKFSDGTVITREGINNMSKLKTLTGTDGNDYLDGSDFDETI
ncbi:MAG: hypothetical protein C0190_05990 [Thermodesulfobacterium geofontis]|uniref:Haemolysin-type calcium binding-related domain-containing protein n=1 Tax=Thermodesulfobacterium geofontis TaxID=1295609 RepID=A0A2N7PMF3_9BACT|nr:MAG: hypothetical protein C0190_05990 [Thermodesulfobacterium geofontis]